MEAGDHDAVGVDTLGMLGDKLVDERLEYGGVDALVGATELLDAVVHPKRRRLRHEHPGKAAKVALDLRLANGCHAVADIGAHGAFALRGTLAFAGAVQVHHERGLLGHDRVAGAKGLKQAESSALKLGSKKPYSSAIPLTAVFCTALLQPLSAGQMSPRQASKTRPVGGVVAVVTGKSRELRDAQLVIEHARAHDAAFDLFGQALLGDLECHMGAHGELAPFSSHGYAARTSM